MGLIEGIGVVEQLEKAIVFEDGLLEIRQNIENWLQGFHQSLTADQNFKAQILRALLDKLHDERIVASLRRLFVAGKLKATFFTDIYAALLHTKNKECVDALNVFYDPKYGFPVKIGHVTYDFAKDLTETLKQNIIFVHRMKEFRKELSERHQAQGGDNDTVEYILF